jgi:Uma2 family endonuclease
LPSSRSGEHADISHNLSGILYNQLLGKPCRARQKDTKVRSGPVPMPGRGMAGMFSYPDIVVICGEPEYHDCYKDVVINPKAIIEALSESTEAFDRGEKFKRFQEWNSTLSDYVLVSQTSPQVEHFARQADSTWSYRLYSGLDAEVRIESIGCSLKLADIYQRVRFGQKSEKAAKGRSAARSQKSRKKRKAR